MNIEKYDFPLSKDIISLFPKSRRDSSKLLIVDREKETFTKTTFAKLDEYLSEGDCLVLNDTYVFPARLYCKSIERDKEYEFLLIKQIEDRIWEVLIKQRRSCKLLEKFSFGFGITAKLISKLESGSNYIAFNQSLNHSIVQKIGQMALPPYIISARDYTKEDEARYQTVYSKKNGLHRIAGSIAAPTAGLHFTTKLIEKLKAKGVKIAFLTLDISTGTFKQITASHIEKHRMDAEEYILKREEADKINETIRARRRIIAVGTTVTRVLEHCFYDDTLNSGKGKTSLFIYPGYKFKIVSSIVTNFHMPKSTPLLLVSAFANINLIKRAYDYAKLNNFTFYSYGDSMLIL